MIDHSLGILRSGPSASVDERGTTTPAGVSWALRWWVAGEDRWHRPDIDAAVRQRLIDDTPVVETTVRIPSGDGIGVSYAFASNGKPCLAGRVTNASPVPVAVAVVVGPAASIEISESNVVVDGRHVIELSRRPSAATCSPTLEGLADLLPEATSVASQLTGYAAVVVPLPHTQAVSWRVFASGVESTVAPEPEQVAAGWMRHAEEGAQLLLPPTPAVAFVRARHRVAMGVAPGASIVAVAEHVGAAVRLGWFDAALDGTDLLATEQVGRGRIGPDEASTAAALDALAAWRRAGIPADRLEHLVGPVVAAARWLHKRVGRLDPSTRRSVDAAVGSAAGFLRFTDQTPIADHLEPGEMAPIPAADIRWSDSSAATVSGLIDALASDGRDGLRLLGGWTPTWGREPIEASGVPTPWGTLSFALRWHGARPAVLWEVEPWPDVVRSEPTLATPALDPTWRGVGWRGEALLAEPDGLSAVAAGESFS